MSGSMREKRPGVWELRAFLGRDTAGKVRHLSVTFEGGKRQAQRALAALVAEIEDSDTELIAEWGPDTTINDAILGWERNGWDDLSPTTARRYKGIWTLHIRDSIGRKRIKALGPYEIERYLRDLKAQGLSRSSVHQTRAVLHRSCRLARKWSGNRLPNPVSDTEMPDWALADQPVQVRAPDPGEVHALLDAARELDLRFAVFLRVIAATGARRGEVCALRWSDIDMPAGTLVIDEAIIAHDGGARSKDPKNRSSIRALALDRGTLVALEELSLEQRRLAEACGAALDERAYVFTTDPTGVTPPHPDAMTKAFARTRRKAGVASDVHLHSLRHFQSTQLDAVISEAQKQARMGWATVQMARHYTGVVTEEDRRAADHIGELLGPPQRAASADG